MKSRIRVLVRWAVLLGVAYLIAVGHAWWTNTPGSENEKVVGIVACLALLRSIEIEVKFDRLLESSLKALQRLDQAQCSLASRVMNMR